MREGFEPRQSEKTAGALDGVNQPKDVAENLGVVRLLLETHELDVDHVETLVGFDQELAEQVVHYNRPSLGQALAAGPDPPEMGYCVG